MSTLFIYDVGANVIFVGSIVSDRHWFRSSIILSIACSRFHNCPTNDWFTWFDACLLSTRDIDPILTFRHFGACVHKMADPSREEEQVTLLGEEGLMAGGQALKLGYAPRSRPVLSWAQSESQSAIYFTVLVLGRWFRSLPITTQASIGVGRSKVFKILVFLCDAMPAFVALENVGLVFHSLIDLTDCCLSEVLFYIFETNYVFPSDLFLKSINGKKSLL